MSDLFDFHLKLPITDPTWVFFLVLSIILFAPLILSKLRIPHIVGMILAGIAIGEYGMYSSASSRLKTTGGASDTLSSLPEARILVNFLLLHTLTQRSPSLVCSPTTWPA